jgi:uncharacterized protein YggU (UPF0235/DUF167 family)
VYLKIKVHPNSKADKVLRKSDDTFEIFVRAKPVDGKANEAVLELVSDYLKVPRSKVRLLRGANSRNKLIETVS